MAGPDPRARVDALFEQALDLDDADREAFLERVSAGQPALREELEALLALASRESPLLDRAPPWAPSSPDGWDGVHAGLERDGTGTEGTEDLEEDDPVGRRIGAWRVLRRLGTGGMGTVYLAERSGDGFRQLGALKRLRLDAGPGDFLRRFAQERQILASLNHPGIARLLDGGRDPESGPFLVMEYVEGEALDHHCDGARLDVERRLALFANVCDAVAHAHRHLIVHRDIKPSNIVVTADGEVKLLDFGIAKVLGAADVPGTPTTRTMTRVFTPEYAAPEQVTGQPATTTTDVYQLGLLLYELLCGRRAQAPRLDSAVALERSICQEAPLRPSLALGDDADIADARRTTPAALRRRLRGDLDTIVLKALRKSPERRYESVDALVQDLARWRQRRPIRARPERLLYRTGKFLRRHPVGVAASISLLGLLVAYAATVTHQAHLIARERDRAQSEATKARQVQALVLQLFEGADPERSGGAQLSARELLDRGWAGIERELGGQPEVRAELLDTVGEAYRQLGLYDRAGPLFDDGLATTRPLAGERPLLLARALRSRGRLLSDEGHYDEADAALRDALARFRAVEGDAGAEVATTLSDLGQARFRASDLGAAERLHRDALAMRRRLFGEEHVDVASSLDHLGTVLRHQGDYAGAEPLLSQALALRRRLLPATHPHLARSLSNLAVTRVNLGEYDSAEALYREARLSMARSRGARHPSVAMVMNNLAMLMQAQRRFDEAESLLRESLEIRREALGPRHPEVAMNLNDLGLALAESGDPEAAVAYYRQALAAYPDGHPWRAATVFNLGMLEEKRGRFAAAEALYREALAAQSSDYGEDHERVGIDLNRIGIVLHRQGRLDEAERYMRQALAIFRKRLPDGQPRLALVLVPLGELMLDQGNAAEALPLLQEAWQVRQAAFGDADARTVEAAAALRRAQGLTRG